MFRPVADSGPRGIRTRNLRITSPQVRRQSSRCGHVASADLPQSVIYVHRYQTVTLSLIVGEQDTSILHTYLTQWCLWMASGGQSSRTIDGRRDTVLLFARRTGADPITCGWEPLAQFLADPRIRTLASRATYRGSLRQWFRWLVIMGHRSDNPADKLPKARAPRGVPRPVSTSQLGQALASGRFYRRTRTMIILGAYQGLRAHEVARFRGEQIRGGALRVLGKGGVEAEIPVHPMVADEATRYPQIGLWFPSPRDDAQPITAKNVSRVVSDALRRAGVDATAHQLRHWYGTQSLRAAKGNLRVAQQLLRHASPATTAIYTRVEDEEMRAAIRALPVPLHVV